MNRILLLATFAVLAVVSVEALAEEAPALDAAVRKKLDTLLRTHESEALIYARAQAAGQEQSYWIGVSREIASVPGLSADTYVLAQNYLESGISRYYDDVSLWLSLSSLQKTLGNIPKAIGSQESAIRYARDKGFTDERLKPFKQTLAELKKLQPIAPTVLDPTVRIGDPAPALPVMAWLKGKPAERFEPGHVYVVEFWTTWCGPCIATIPQLTALQKKYEGRLTVIGVNARQALHTEGAVDRKEIRTTVETMIGKQGERMAYTVAMDDPVKQPVFETWENGSGCIYLGTAFVVDRAGKVVWIGFPGGAFEQKFDAAIEGALNGASDLAAARAVQDEQFSPSQRISIRYSIKLAHLLKSDEAAALKFVRDGAADKNLRAAIGVGSDDGAYWGEAGIEIAAQEGLSPETYRMAAGYLQQSANVHGGGIGPWLALGRLYHRLGDKPNAVAAQQTVIDMLRKSGASDREVAPMQQMLEQYK